jgi:O-antigen ligase
MTWPVKTIRFCFYLLLFITPLIFLPNTSELFEFNKMVVTYLFSAAIATTWAVDMITNRKFIFKRTSLDLPIIAFLSFQFISLIFSLDQRTSLMGYYSRFNGGFLSLLCYSVLYWAYVTYMDRKAAFRSISVSMWTLTLVSAYGILEHFGIDASLWVQDVQNRVFSTLGQPNWLAAYIVSLFFLSFYKVFSKSDWLKFILPSVLFLTLLYTKSRSGLLALGFGGLFFLWQLFTLDKQQKPKHLPQTLLSIAAIFFIFTISFPNPIRDLVISSKTNLTPGKSAGPALEVGGTESGAIRKIVWTGAIRIWRSNAKTFFIGTGPETFTMGYYQNRPIEHNNTSEWDLLYNKAHNEFLNYLSTTGLFGLLTYLLLLAVMAKQIFINSKKAPGYTLLHVSLLSGWLTIPITNFWGFSVVVVQLLLFLLPAVSTALLQDPKPAQTSATTKHLTIVQIFLFLIAICVGAFSFFSIFKYWLADLKYASGQYSLKAFRSTSDPQYVLNAYQTLHQAFTLNSADPTISSDLSLATAYMSVLTFDTDSTASAELANTALLLSKRAISQSPSHPNYYKSLSRTAMLLATTDDNKMSIALDALSTARVLSPTDPLIPYNLGVIYKYQNRLDLAQVEFQNSLRLKPDHADAAEQLAEIAGGSAQKSK